MWPRKENLMDPVPLDNSSNPPTALVKMWNAFNGAINMTSGMGKSYLASFTTSTQYASYLQNGRDKGIGFSFRMLMISLFMLRISLHTVCSRGYRAEKSMILLVTLATSPAGAWGWIIMSLKTQKRVPSFFSSKY